MDLLCDSGSSRRWRPPPKLTIPFSCINLQKIKKWVNSVILEEQKNILLRKSLRAGSTFYLHKVIFFYLENDTSSSHQDCHSEYPKKKSVQNLCYVLPVFNYLRNIYYYLLGSSWLIPPISKANKWISIRYCIKRQKAWLFGKIAFQKQSVFDKVLLINCIFQNVSICLNAF